MLLPRYTFIVSERPYTVHIVVDPTFGDKLLDLPDREPVWVVDSPANTPVIRRIWSKPSPRSHLEGVTSFVARTGTPEDVLLSELDMIDLHHGEYSADPSWGRAVVYGARLTSEVVAAFADFGFSRVTPTADGFVADRENISN